MTLFFHDTLTRRKVPFAPLDPAHVRLYACGPTVYDHAHIGNARPVVVFDVLYRLLRHHFPRVTYVRNITDIDDKINARAAESGQDIRELTETTAREFQRDMAAIGSLPPDREPRATEHVVEMIVMIETLLERDHAYAAEGHVLFSVQSMPEYGALSRLDREQLIDGARVEVAPYKRDPADFVLWKPSPPGTPGWDSPWGFGRPGWHIECSAMSHAYLGKTFDIHAGGIDLVFPHHENEIAQTRCAFGTHAMATVWMHNGFVTVEGEKMSKSLGNFYTVHDLLAEWPGEAIRYALLAAQYRAPLDYGRRGLAEARSALDRLYQALRPTGTVEPSTPSEPVLEALGDDLNTPLALAGLHRQASALNRADTDAERREIAGELRASGLLLGLLQSDPEAWFQAGATTGPDETGIQRLIQVRNEARAARDFATADRIRDQLRADGIALEDGADGTSWKRLS